MSDDITARVLQVVKETTGKTGILAEDQLLEKGTIDSFDIINLIEAFEGAFGIIVPADAIVPANFGRVSDMARLVASLSSR